MSITLRAVLVLSLLAACGSDEEPVRPVPPEPTPAPPSGWRDTRAPVPESLRPVAPVSGSRIAAARPTFVAHVPPGTTDVVLERCAELDCTTVIGTDPVRAGAATASEDLRGRVYFRFRAGTVTSATWWIDVRPAAGTTSTLTRGDLSCDGIADLVIATTMGPPPSDRAHLHLGGATGISGIEGIELPSGRGRSGLPGRHVARGDTNGDGCEDLLAGPVLAASGGARTSFPGSTRLAVLADVDGDGLDDVIRADPYHDTSADPPHGAVFVHRSSIRGMPADPSTTLTLEGVSLLGTELAALGDLNRDGFDDVGVSAITGAATTPTQHVLVLFGGPDGLTVAHRVEIEADGSPFTPTEAAPLGRGWTAEFVLIEGLFDENHDGSFDLAVLERHGNDYHLQLVYGGTFLGAGPNRTVPMAASIAALSDLDGDGHRELAIVASGADVLFGGAREEHLSWSGVPRVSSPGDLDRDGYGDLVVAGLSDEVHVLYGGPSGVSSRDAMTIVSAPHPGAMQYGAWAE